MTRVESERAKPSDADGGQGKGAEPDRARSGPQAATAPTPLQRRNRDLNVAAVKLMQGKDYAGAVPVLLEALSLEPEDGQALQNLGLAHYWLGDLAAAERCLRAAVKARPRHPDCARHLLSTLERQGRFREAVAFGCDWLARLEGATPGVRKLSAFLAPGHDPETLRKWSALTRVEADALRKFKANLGLALLRAGDWNAGWDMYRYRVALHDGGSASVPSPHFDGQLVRGAGVVVYGEQGLGDTIMFARFASLLGAQGANVFYMTHPKLGALLKPLPNVLEVVPYGHEVKAERLMHVRVVDLASYFDVTPETIPRVRRYVTAQPERVDRWRHLLAADRLNVGIAWQGSRENKSDAQRSIPLAAFAPLADLDAVNLISLQVGDGLEQAGEVPFAERLTVPGEDFDTGPDAMLDAAGLCASLDLVICCDSAIGHLAGAMGRPVFLALPMVADWRWLAEGEATDWYPEHRLFRQRMDGVWGDVLRTISNRVAEMAAVKRSAGGGGQDAH